MSESFVWTTDVLSSSVWSCCSDSTKLWHKATFLGTVLLLCDLSESSWSLLQYLTVYLYDVSCCERDQIFWYLSQVLWRLRSCTRGLWREPKVVWCGPNVVFLPLSLSLAPTLSRQVPVMIKRNWDECLRRCQGSGELEPFMRNSKRRRVIIHFTISVCSHTTL